MEEGNPEDRLLQQNKKLKREINDLNDKLKEVVAKNKKARAKPRPDQAPSNINAYIRNLRKTEQMLSKDYNMLQQKLDALSNERVEKLETQATKLKEKAKDLDQEVKDLQLREKDIDKVEKRHETFGDDLKSMKQTVREYEAKSKAYERRIGLAQQSQNEFQEKLKELEAFVPAPGQAPSQPPKPNANMLNEYNEVNKKIREIELNTRSEELKLNLKVKELTNQLRKNKAIHRELNLMISKKEGELEDTDREIEQLQSHYNVGNISMPKIKGSATPSF